MENLQEQVKEICLLSDAVVRNPSQSIESIALQAGVSSSITTFATTGLLVFAPPFIAMGPLEIIIWAANKILYKKKESVKKKNECFAR